MIHRILNLRGRVLPTARLASSSSPQQQAPQLSTTSSSFSRLSCPNTSYYASYRLPPARWFYTSNMPPKKQDQKQTQEGKKNGHADAKQPHQFQAGDSTHRDEDQWKHREPYAIHDDGDGFDVKWTGKCHCGKVTYQLSRDKPLASKYCHCTTCQRLHGAPFQWATIFHKGDINFVNGHHDLGWYDPTEKSTTHHLPCKVSCAYCRTPIMDEGRNMILLYPELIEGINTKKAREAFAPTCHMFYSQRVVELKGDGLVKWKGLDNSSDLIDDDDKVLIKFEEGMKPDDMKAAKKRKRMSAANEESG